MGRKLQDSEMDEEWTQLCHELEKAKRNYEEAEATIAASCGAAPKNGDETADTRDALQKSIEANKRKLDILKRMRIFISQHD